ncbi:hypothetical protein RLIN73S_05097 [Rhodanobacter lindaniclasticus]
MWAAIIAIFVVLLVSLSDRDHACGKDDRKKP